MVLPHFWCFNEFSNELFSVIESKKPEKTLLDLRAKSGGNSTILEPFLQKNKNGLSKQPTRFFVLIGKRMFSSDLMNAVNIKRRLSATLVGEPTGGNINHFGEVQAFELPKSKLNIAD